MSIKDLVPWKRKTNGHDPRRPERLEGLLESMDMAFDDFWAPLTGARVLGPSFFGGARDFGLDVDVEETPTSITVSAALPGVDKKDLQVSVTQDTLVIRGERRTRKEYEGRARQEAYGSFHRSISLPAPVDAGGVKASYKDGMLTVELPKTRKAQGRRIEID